jgi:hypothetical protein
MDPILIYKLLHIAGFAALFLGLGGMFALGDDSSGKRKPFGMWHGIALIILLVSGFGMLARQKLGFPVFAMVKTVLWLVLGAMPVLARRKVLSPSLAIIVSILLALVLAWLGLAKPWLA